MIWTNCVILVCALHTFAGGTAVTASPLQGVQDSFRYNPSRGREYRGRYENATSKPVITAYHVPQMRNPYVPYREDPHDHRRQIQTGRRQLDNPMYFNRGKEYYSKQFYSKPFLNEVNLRSSKDNKVLTSGVFRTYGRGKATIPYVGASVNARKISGYKKAHKGTVTTKIGVPNPNGRSNRKAVFGSRKECSGCPDDHIVVASKGNTFVILPEPCPTLKWTSIEGPQPGSKLREGRHWLSGRLGRRKKICYYQYQVIVRHCKPLRSDDLDISCTAEDAWGSRCTISCGKNREVVGSSTLDCTDHLTWSKPLPTCRKKQGCSIPNVPDDSKVSCQTADEEDLEDDILPEQSYCRLTINDHEKIIQCSDGAWIEANKTVTSLGSNIHDDGDGNEDGDDVDDEKYRYTITNDNKIEDDVCYPNPCKNNGTCLRPFNGKASPICNCKPFTQGPRCEFKECKTNMCENGGRCLILENKTMCYCLPSFSGNKCQLYHVQD